MRKLHDRGFWRPVVVRTLLQARGVHLRKGCSKLPQTLVQMDLGDGIVKNNDAVDVPNTVNSHWSYLRWKRLQLSPATLRTGTVAEGGDERSLPTSLAV